MRYWSICAVLVAAGAAPTVAEGKPWKPHPIKVIPGVPLKADDIKPYTPPKLLPEPPIDPSDVKVVEVSVPEATISMRPWGSPLLGTTVQGARLPVKGTVKPIKGSCGKLWYALEPFGYICGKEAHPTDKPAMDKPLIDIREGMRVPFQYVMVLVKEGDKVPMWASLDDKKKGNEPERQLERGDTVAVEKAFTWDGEKLWISVEGKVIPQKGSSMMGTGAEWHGLDLDDKITLPFGWITPDKANVYSAPPEKGQKPVPIAQIDRRTRINIVEDREVAKKKWIKFTVAAPAPAPTFGNIFLDNLKKAPETPPPPAPPLPAGDLWVSADAVNEVRVLEHPKTVPADTDKWIDVDLGEQVLVAYEKDKPVFATLVSSGRAIPTPMGTYPVWAKVQTITMKNQPYEDKGYFVNKVPWSTFFQWHNAIHGAYWHDRFGVTKSHGCVNVSPLDAKHVFEWVTPPLPNGWSGYRPEELLKSPYVVTRNSHMKKMFRQDRPIGAPDKGLEAERVAEADARRADEAAKAAQAAAAAPATNPDGTPAPVPAPAPAPVPPPAAIPSGQAPPKP
jgi:lipoprotein-anchoring transpeptidase ErfK/SrfK